MGNLASAHDPARRHRPRPGRRGLRDHRPRARHRRRCCAATSTTSTRASSALTGDPGDDRDDRGRWRRRSQSARARSCPRGGYEVDAHSTHGHRDRQRRRGPDLLDPGHLVRCSSPADIHTLLRGKPSMTLLSIPSPAQGVWHLGPLPIRGYALASSSASSPRSGSASGAGWPAAAGAARSRTSRSGRCRSAWSAAGSTTWPPTTTSTSAPAATPGSTLRLARRAGRLGRDRPRRGRRRDLRPPHAASGCCPMIDALAPGLLVAQALGRWGNWFNQELFGRPTDLPWGLEIDPGAPAAGLRGPGRPSTRRSSTSACWDLLVLRGPDRARPAVQARPRADARALRHGLHPRPRLDRDAAHRHRRAQRRARAPVQRVDLDRAVRRRGGLLRRQRAGSGPGREESVYVERSPRGPADAQPRSGTGPRRSRRRPTVDGAHDPESRDWAGLVCLIG